MAYLMANSEIMDIACGKGVEMQVRNDGIM